MAIGQRLSRDCRALRESCRTSRHGEPKRLVEGGTIEMTIDAVEDFLLMKDGRR